MPAGARPGATPLIVVVVPGGDGDSSDRLGVGAAATRAGFAVLYPTSEDSFWSLNRAQGTADVDAVKDLLDRVLVGRLLRREAASPSPACPTAPASPPGWPARCPAASRPSSRSPPATARSIPCPAGARASFLAIHGSADTVVPVQRQAPRSRRLGPALHRALGAPRRLCRAAAHDRAPRRASRACATAAATTACASSCCACRGPTTAGRAPGRRCPTTTRRASAPRASCCASWPAHGAREPIRNPPCRRLQVGSLARDDRCKPEPPRRRRCARRARRSWWRPWCARNARRACARATRRSCSATGRSRASSAARAPSRACACTPCARWRPARRCCCASCPATTTRRRPRAR